MKPIFILLTSFFTLIYLDLHSQSISTGDFYRRYHKVYVVSDGKALDQQLNQYSGNIHSHSPGSTTNQQWVVMPLYIVAKNGVITTSNDYMMASRYNGKIVDINSKNNVYCTSVVRADDRQTFRLNSRGSKIYEVSSLLNTSYTFDKTGSSQNRNPFDHPNQYEDNIYFNTRHGGTNQQFNFNGSSFFSNYSNLSTLRNQRIPQVPFPRQPTSFSDLMPTQTSKTFVAETLLPFPLIQNDLSLSYQVENTPYYKLIKYQYYKLADLNADITYLPNSTVTRSVSVKTGMKQTDVTKVNSTLNVQFTANGEVGGSFLKALTFKVSASLSRSLKLEQESINTIEQTYEKTETFSYVFQNNQSVRILTYVLVDSYELTRADGSLVMSWDVRTDKVKERTYPSEVLLNGRATGSALTQISKTKTINVTIGSSGSRTSSAAQKVSEVTGSSNTTNFDKALNVKVYPNPVKDALTLVYTEDAGEINKSSECTVILYNLDGLVVYEHRYVNNSDKKEIDMSHLPTGLYLVKVIAGSGVKTERIYKE